MLRRPAAWNAVVAFIVAVTAGCTDNPLPEAAEAEAGALPGVPTSTGLAALPIGYAGPEHFMKDRWENGSFMATDSAWPLGGPIHMVLQDPRAERVFDITDDLPPGVPAMVMLELASSVRGGTTWPHSGNVALGIRTNEMDYVAGTWDTPFGARKEAAVTVQRLSGEPIGVVVFYGAIDPSVQVTYSLHITVMGSANVVPGGAVFGVRLAPGDVLMLEALGDGTEVAVFDAADDLVGRHDVSDRTEIRVPPHAAAGEFIVVTKENPGALRVSAIRNDTDPLRPIGFEWVPGAEKPLGGSPVRWEEDVTRPIVSTGLWIHGTDQPFRCQDVQGTVVGPGDDELVSITASDTGCVGGGPFGWDVWAETDHGLAEVREGTYTIEVSAPQSVGMVAQEWYLHYKR